ncbi:nitrite reductase/ring-hydroxylating ferredoxin subunit [Pedobacter sp. UYP30]|uniref:Rieske (2Fe-2S) protein n=1 Tax=Pedobacter sp. UYP30 TaxID=1756400 RepID=UPI003390EDFF
MQWIKVLNSFDLPKENDIKTISANGKQLCVINDASKIYVTQSICPHAGGHFSGGWCKNGHLICPIHRYAYSLENGRGAEGQGDYINIYPTEIRKDGLYVGFQKSWLSKIFG